MKKRIEALERHRPRVRRATEIVLTLPRPVAARFWRAKRKGKLHELPFADAIAILKARDDAEGGRHG